MTSRILLKWSLGLAFGLLPLVGGSRQESSSPPPNPTPSAAEATPAPSPGDISGPGVPGDVAEPSLDDLANAPVTPITASTEKPAPPNIRPNSPVSEIVRLANSGVDVNVMLAFVTNSQSTFNLQADEIIYLNDIGVPGPVVTAMLQHDQNFAAMHPAPAPAPAPMPQPEPMQPPQPEPQQPPPIVEAPLTPPESSDYPAFYDSLAPYGNWVNVGGYGPCWQPTVVVVNAGWQPYLNCGHWAYTDCGWYWASDYSWGWAPFHYGRWFHHNNLGWCWAPGHVWGPSWVSWRYSNDYCGWAPLPPGATFTFGFGLSFHGHPVHDGFDCAHPGSYCFVPWNAFNNHQLSGFAVTGHQGNQIFHQTVVVNRVVANHNTVINQGISAARVAAATHQVVEPLKLSDTGFGAPGGGRTERVDPTRRTLSVYRPQIAPSPTPATIPGRPGLSPTRSAGTTSFPAASLSTPHATGTAPLILRGQQQLSPPQTAANVPANSLVVIGRQQNARSSVPARTGMPQWTPSAQETASVDTRPDSRTLDNSRTPTTTTIPARPQQPAWNYPRNTAVQTPRTDPSRATPWLQTVPAAPTAPPAQRQYNVPQNNPAPVYNVQRSYSAPNPAYRASAPAYSAPSPSYSAPSRASSSEVPRSAPAPSYSGGGGGGARSAPSAPPASSAGRQDNNSSSSSSSGHR